MKPRGFCQVLFLVFLFGCASVISGSKQSLSVDTPNAPGATCRGVDKRGVTYFWTNTPATTTVNKGDGPMTITCRKKGFKPTIHVIDETLVTSFWGNILLGGVIGMVVDAASGAAQEYESLVVIPLEPQEDASPQAKEEYKNLKAQIEEQKKQKEMEKKKKEEEFRKQQEESQREK